MPVAAVVGAAAIGAGANIISGNKAAKAGQQASAASIAEERRQYDRTRADYAPYREVGYGALGKLATMYGVAPVGADGKPTATYAGSAAPDTSWQTSPGYEWRLNQGIQAAERSAAARGLLRSGGTMKAIQRYGEGLASSEYENYANRLAAMAGIGQSATGSTAAAGAQATQGITNAYMNAGNARASAYQNTGAQIGNLAGNLAGAYMYGKGYGTPGYGG